MIAERPKLLPHIPAMRVNLSRAIGIDVSAVSVKGKTNEKVDALGRNEAIAVHAVAYWACRLRRSPRTIAERPKVASTGRGGGAPRQTKK